MHTFSSGGCRISWLFFKAVRAGLAVTTIISEAIGEERVRPLPDQLRINLDMRPPNRQSGSDHPAGDLFDRNERMPISGTGH
jgi:hypothetical protein